MDKLLKVIAEQNEEAECCFQLKRIADALDTVINMVKEDQERTRKYMEEKKDE